MNGRIVAALLACFMLLPGCGAADEAEVYIAGGPFAVGGLLPREDKYDPREVAYGNFPFISCEPALEPLAYGFAHMQLNPEDKLTETDMLNNMYFCGAGYDDALQTFLYGLDAEHSVVYDYAGKEFYNKVFFEPAIPNVLLALNITDADRAFIENGAGAAQIELFARMKDAVAVVTWRDNETDNLTSEQLRDILSGDIDDWSQLGGQMLPIKKYYKDADLTLLEKYVMDGKTIIDGESKPHDIPNGVGGEGYYTIDVYAPFVDEPGSLGIMSYKTALEKGVKILSVDGIAPNDETLKRGEYLLVTNCFAVYRKSDSALAPGNFADWLHSGEGRGIIEGLGWAPVD